MEEHSDGHTRTSGSNTNMEQHGTRIADGREGDRTRDLRKKGAPFVCPKHMHPSRRNPTIHTHYYTSKITSALLYRVRTVCAKAKGKRMRLR